MRAAALGDALLEVAAQAREVFGLASSRRRRPGTRRGRPARRRPRRGSSCARRARTRRETASAVDIAVERRSIAWPSTVWPARSSRKVVTSSSRTSSPGDFGDAGAREEARRLVADELHLDFEVGDGEDGLEVEAALERGAHLVDAEVARVGGGDDVEAVPREEHVRLRLPARESRARGRRAPRAASPGSRAGSA